MKVVSVSADEQKRRAGERAALLVEDGMRVGLGSGTTALAFVRALGERVHSGLWLQAVSSSVLTSRLAHDVGIDVIKFEGRLDLAIDGADAIETGTLCAIKGLGGALTREKLVALAADQFVLVGDSSKVFDRLADSQPRIPVPVEIVPFGWRLTREQLGLLGEPVLRERDGEPFISDNGNLIIDLYSADYTRLADLACAIKEITGVVEHGLFLHMASSAIIASDNGVEDLVAAGK